MKWNNKLHEFDEIADNYKQNGVFSKEVYIFGAGDLGKRFVRIASRLCKFRAFIDNDEEKHHSVYCGFPVISFKDYLCTADYEKSFIILCLKLEYCDAVKKQLIANGLVEKKMFMEMREYERYLRIMLFYEKKFIYMPIAQISLTERCTLRCEKCAHACNLVSHEKMDMEISDAKLSADYFFKYVDYVDEFVLIGGEPLLYRKIDEIADYIGDRYRAKIGIFSITTNGTILPQEKLLAICRKHDMFFRISNYEESVPYLNPKLSKFQFQ